MAQIWDLNSIAFDFQLSVVLEIQSFDVDVQVHSIKSRPLVTGGTLGQRTAELEKYY